MKAFHLALQVIILSFTAAEEGDEALQVLRRAKAKSKKQSQCRANLDWTEEHLKDCVERGAPPS